jgi:hypothetical protein
MFCLKETLNPKPKRRSGMKKYIGIDAHCKYCDVAVVDEEGKLLSQVSVKTSAYELIEAIKKVKGERAVVVEESTLAGWLQRTLIRYCDQFQVSDPLHNDSIARSEKKSDRHDAETLAQLYRGGYTKPVHHTQDMRHFELKEAVQHYHDYVDHIVCWKNKVKALYRKHGVFLPGDQVYDPEESAQYLELLPDATSRQRVRDHLCVLGTLERLTRKAERRMRPLSCFRALPGWVRLWRRPWWRSSRRRTGLRRKSSCGNMPDWLLPDRNQAERAAKGMPRRQEIGSSRRC